MVTQIQRCTWPLSHKDGRNDVDMIDQVFDASGVSGNCGHSGCKSRIVDVAAQGNHAILHMDRDSLGGIDRVAET